MSSHPKKIMRFSYDTPFIALLRDLVQSESVYVPSDFKSIIFFDESGQHSDEEATRFWFDLNFTIENITECYKLHKGPNTWRYILYIGFSKNYYINYHYILNKNNQSFIDTILTYATQDDLYLYKQYKQHIPLLKMEISDQYHDMVSHLLQLFIIPFCVYRNTNNFFVIVISVRNHSRSPITLYKKDILHFAPFQDIINIVNVYTIDASNLTHFKKYTDTLEYLYQHDILNKNAMDILLNDVQFEEKREWFQIEYNVDTFVAPRESMNLQTWYSVLFIGYYNNTPLQITHKNFHHIFNLYNLICVMTFRKDLTIEDPTLEDLMDIFEGTQTKHSYLIDMNFFDVMFLRPFLQWKIQEHVPSHFKTISDVVKTFKIDNYDTYFETDYEHEIMLVRYSLIKMHFASGLVDQHNENMLIDSKFRDRTYISSAITQLTTLIFAHKDDFRTYEDYATEMEITPTTSFQTVMEHFRKDETQIIDVVLYEENSSRKVLISSGVGLAKQWFTEHYTSKNVLSFLQNDTQNIPMSTILNFGYKHKFGLVIEEDLFYFLVELYNKANDKKLVFRYDHAQGFLLYLLSGAKDYNIDLFLQSALNTDYKEYCQGTLREEDDNPHQLKSYVQEDYEFNFEDMQLFVDNYLCSDLPVSYDLATLNTELRAKKIPYFSKVTSKRAKYMRSVYEHFMNITYDVNRLKTIFSQQEPDATLKIITALDSFSEQELQDFVLTSTGLRSFPKDIKVTTYNHTPTDTRNSGFQFHTCTNHIEFPKQLLTISNEEFENYLKNSLMTRFTILGGDGNGNGNGNGSMNAHYLVSLLRALLLTLVLGTTLHLIQEKKKRNTPTIIVGACIFILYVIVLFLQYTYKYLWILVSIMDIISIIYVMWVLSRHKTKIKNQ